MYCEHLFQSLQLQINEYSKSSSTESTYNLLTFKHFGNREVVMQKFVIFTDPNKDVDDLIAIIMLNNMKKAKLIDIAGIVTTHGSSETTFKRAVYTQGVCRLMGNNLSICAGVPEIHQDDLSNRKANSFYDAFGLDKIMASSDLKKVKTDSESYLKEIFEKAEPKSLEVLAIAQVNDIQNFIEKHSELFCEKVRTVFIQAGFEEKENMPAHDDSYNLMCNIDAARKLFNFLLKEKIQTNFIHRSAVLEVQVGMNFYKNFNESGTLIGSHVYNAQQQFIRSMYKGIFSGETLARQTPEWFYKIFTDIDDKEYEKFKNAGLKSEIIDEVMSRVTKLNLYDPLTLLAAIDEYKPMFNCVRKKHNFEMLKPKNKAAIYEYFNKWTNLQDL